MEENNAENNAENEAVTVKKEINSLYTSLLEFYKHLATIEGLNVGDNQKLLHVLTAADTLERMVDLFKENIGPSAETSVATAILTQRHHEETNKEEWALVSKKVNPKTGKRKVLYWFGAKKPSSSQVAERERIVQYWKHRN